MLSNCYCLHITCFFFLPFLTLFLLAGMFIFYPIHPALPCSIFAPSYVLYWRRQWHPLQYSCLENPMDRGAWCFSPWGHCESGTTEQLRFHFSLSSLEKEMATHSSVLAWRIPGKGEPGGLPSMGSNRVGHD